MFMLNCPHIDLVIIRMGSNPLNKNNLSAIIDGDNQSIAVPFDVEDYAVRSNDAGISIAGSDISGTAPFCPCCLMKPRVHG
jgi:hypothetical protein